MAIGAVGAETQSAPAQESAKPAPAEAKESAPAPAAEEPAAEIDTQDAVSLSPESAEEEESNAPPLSGISDNYGKAGEEKDPEVREDGTEIRPGDPDYDPSTDPLEDDKPLGQVNGQSNAYAGPPVDPEGSGSERFADGRGSIPKDLKVGDDLQGRHEDWSEDLDLLEPGSVQTNDPLNSIHNDYWGRPEDHPVDAGMLSAAEATSIQDPSLLTLDDNGVNPLDPEQQFTPADNPDAGNLDGQLDASPSAMIEPQPDVNVGAEVTPPVGELSGSAANTINVGVGGKPVPNVGAQATATQGLSGSASTSPNLGASGTPVPKSGNTIDIEDAKLKNGEGSARLGEVTVSATVANAQMGSFKNDDKNLSLGKTEVDKFQMGGATVSGSWGGFQYDKSKGLFGGGLSVEKPQINASLDLNKTRQGAAQNVVGAVNTVKNVATGQGITGDLQGKAEEASVGKVDAKVGDNQVKMTNASVKNANVSVAAATDGKGNIAGQGSASAQNVKVESVDAQVGGYDVSAKGVDVNNASATGTGVLLSDPKGGQPTLSGSGSAQFQGKVDEAHLKGNGQEAHVNGFDGAGSASVQNGQTQGQATGKVGEAFYKDGTQEYHVANGEIGAKLGKDGAVEVAAQSQNFSAATGGNRIDTYQAQTGARITQGPEGSKQVQLAPSYLGAATFQDAKGNSGSIEGARLAGGEINTSKAGTEWQTGAFTAARVSGQDKDGNGFSATDLALQGASGTLKPAKGEDGKFDRAVPLATRGATTPQDETGPAFLSTFQAKGLEVGTLEANAGEASVRVEKGSVGDVKLDEKGTLDIQGIKVGSLEAANGGVRARLEDGSIEHLTKDAQGKVDLDKLQVGSLSANGVNARGLDIEKIGYDKGATTVTNVNLAGLNAGGAQISKLHLDQAKYEDQVADLNGLKIGQASMGPAQLRDISLDQARYSPGRFQAQGLGVGSGSVGPASLQSVKLRSLDMATQSGGDFSADGLSVGRVGVGPFGTSVGAGHIGRKSGKMEASGINLAGMDLPWLRI